jgi:hypothetical protein
MSLWAVIAAVTIPLLVVSILFGGWVFLILLIPALLAAIAILFFGGSERTRARRVTEEKPELLGPSGPDNPDRSSESSIS